MSHPPPAPRRLPSERASFALRATAGSAWSPLAGRDGGFTYDRARTLPECILEIALTHATEGDAFEQVFLTDADVLSMSDPELDGVLSMLRHTFPRLALVSAAARPASVLGRAPAALERLPSQRLGLIYFTPESGDPALMRRLGVADPPDAFAAAARRVTAAGMLAGAVIVLGAGGAGGSAAHVEGSAALLGRMAPRHVTFVAHTDRGLLGPRGQLLDELGYLIAHAPLDDARVSADLDVDGRPFDARLPAERDALLARVRAARR